LISVPPEPSFDRRRSISGTHEDRLSGLRDLLVCAQGMTVLDIAMNHGLIGFELARFGASLVHGCDVHAPCVDAAREIFAEIATPSRFEVVDLTGGAVALQSAFGDDYRQHYDIVLFLGIYHKLKEQTSMSVITDLVHHLMHRTARYFVIRTSMIDELDAIATNKEFSKVHYSALSSVVGPMAIWRRD
jgi:2-polyprenyl-3-methyl-5-hydroxy-6-metoxy-1,4-benzoquinol methylase